MYYREYIDSESALVLGQSKFPVSEGRSQGRLWLETATSIVERGITPMYFEATEFLEMQQQYEYFVCSGVIWFE